MRTWSWSLIGMAAWIVCLAPVASAREMVYSEDFSSDPGFTLFEGYMPISGEYFEWDPGLQVYKVRIAETDPPVNKFAVSAPFVLPTWSCMHISLDVNIVESSYGFPISARFCVDGDPTQVGVHVSFRGDHDAKLLVGDGQHPSYEPTAPFPYNEWHNVDIYTSAGVADIRITSLATGEVYAEWTGVDFTPDAFDSFAMGHTTGNNDGSWGEIHCDNVVVECWDPSPTVDRTWGQIKHDFR